MYTNIAKNPLRTFLGLNREKNKNIKASPKKRSSYKKKCTHFFYKQHVHKHASMGFLEKLSTSLSTPSGSDWLEATKIFQYHLEM